MGEAKRRGTLEQRQAAALERNLQLDREFREKIELAMASDARLQQRPHGAVNRRLLVSASLAAALALAGCQSYGGLSADQIAQIVKDKSASSGCISAAGGAGVIKVAWSTADKGTLNGSQSVGADCTLLTQSAEVPKGAACAKQSYERAPDGTCMLVTKGTNCQPTGFAVVDPSKCP